MRAFRLPALAVATLTLVAATPSFAGSPYYDAMGAPMTADQADMVMHDRMMGDQMASGTNCSAGQPRTHITRKNCGTTKSMH